MSTYEKYTVPPEPAAAMDYPATGIPVNSTNQHYTNNKDLQPAPLLQAPVAAWSTGLFGCFSDVKNCCMTFWCPCITFGQIAEIVDEGSTSCGVSGALYMLIAMVTGCAPVYSCCYRSKMRHQYALKESPCADCLVHFFCERCALCQEYRELQNRGFNMQIGWHGNLAEKNPGVAMAPPVVEGRMSR